MMVDLQSGEIDFLLAAVITAKRPIENSQDIPYDQKREVLVRYDAMIEKLREAKANSR